MNVKKHAKRVLSVILSVCLLQSAFVTAQAASDMDGHWAQEQMQAFIDKGLINGYGNGDYGLDDPMDRAQYAALINRITGLTEEADISVFADVREDAWYYSDMAKAYAAGYMSGTSDNTMSPELEVTREQAVTMMARLLGLKASEQDVEALKVYSDLNKVSDWAVDAFAAMVKAGYVAGTTATTLAPQGTLTRAQGVTILHRALAALEALNGGDLIDGVYTGTGAGYGGTITVQMTVENGKITAIEILENSETAAYLKRAQKILNAILEGQSTEGVDTVSGATKTSKGLLTAVEACLSQAQGGKDTSKTGSTGGGGGGGGAGDSTPTEGEDFMGALADGTYTGSATGYSGTTKVTVTVAGGKITAVVVDSHGDTASYMTRAKKVIDDVIAGQSTDVDAVSGATYSSYGILNAINDALKEAVPSTAKTYQVASWSELVTALAKAVDGDTIKLAEDITDAGDVDAISTPTVTINKAITIDGNNKTITASEDTVYTVTTNEETGEETKTETTATFCFAVTTASGIVMKDLTIDGASFSSKLGGAMYVETGAEITLEGVTFKNCHAASGSTHNSGGAIYVEPHRGTAPTLTAIDCTFINNKVNDGTTGRGGAVAGYNANIVLKDCTFEGNTAGWGGAVSAAGTTSLTVTGCTFADSNEAKYGGDDIYIFDGYTFYKKTMAADSAVVYNLSGNNHETDGGTYDEYKVVLGRVLGNVLDNTNIAGNETVKTCVGSGNAVFVPGHDLTFAVTDYDRTAEPTENEVTGTFVLMNIPYDKFYAAEGVEGVDAVTTATVKTYNQGKAAGSYHEGYPASIDNPKEDTKDAKILGVTYPVYVSDVSVLENLTEVKAEDTEEITVASGKSALKKVEATGSELLFVRGDYAYYVLDEAPNAYKVLSVDGDGNFSFSASTAMTMSAEGKASVTYNGNYTNIGFALVTDKFRNDEGKVDTANVVVHAIILTTADGEQYALRHVVDVWDIVDLGWNWDSLDGSGLGGKTIDKLTYYVKDNDGLYKIYEFDLEDQTVKQQYTAETSAAFEDANTIMIEGLNGLENPKATVKTKVGRGQTSTVIADNVALEVEEGSAVINTTSSTVVGAYTITVTSDNYADIVTETAYEISGSGYVLMNIPYDEFYAAEGIVGVDAVTSATVKTYNQNMAGGSYHAGYEAADPIGSAEILGVTYPVYVADLSVLSGKTQVTDLSAATITVASGKSSLTTKDVSGADLLFASGDYAFYILKEAPNAYKTLTADGSEFSFDAVTGVEPVTDKVMTVEMAYGGHYTNIEFNVTADEITDTAVVNAITLTDSDGNEYALRHVEDIWRKTSLGWNWSSLDGDGLAGKTITKVTYYIVDNGVYSIYEYAVNETVKLNPGEITAVFDNANTITVTGLPEDITDAKATVKTVVGRGETATVIAENVDVVDGTITTTSAAEAGTYTITVTSENYGDISTTSDYTVEDATE